MKEAFKDYSNATEYNQQYTMAYNNRGILKGMIKEFDAAVEDFNKAVKFDLDYIEFYYGITNYNLNKPD